MNFVWTNDRHHLKDYTFLAHIDRESSSNRNTTKASNRNTETNLFFESNRNTRKAYRHHNRGGMAVWPSPISGNYSRMTVKHQGPTWWFEPI